MFDYLFCKKHAYIFASLKKKTVILLPFVKNHAWVLFKTFNVVNLKHNIGNPFFVWWKLWTILEKKTFFFKLFMGSSPIISCWKKNLEQKTILFRRKDVKRKILNIFRGKKSFFFCSAVNPFRNEKTKTNGKLDLPKTFNKPDFQTYHFEKSQKLFHILKKNIFSKIQYFWNFNWERGVLWQESHDISGVQKVRPKFFPKCFFIKHFFFWFGTALFERRKCSVLNQSNRFERSQNVLQKGGVF